MRTCFDAFVNGLVYGTFVLEEVWPHDAIVQDDGTIEVSGDHQPNQEEALQ